MRNNLVRLPGAENRGPWLPWYLLIPVGLGSAALGFAAVLALLKLAGLW